MKTNVRAEYRTSIGRRLSGAIRGAGFSHNAVARLLGVSKSTLSSWTNGRTQPALEQLLLVCSATRTSADAILGLPPGLTPSDASAMIEASAFMAEVGRRAIARTKGADAETIRLFEESRESLAGTATRLRKRGL